MIAATHPVAVIAPTDLGTILSVWAHPDDETYLAGGVMAAARAAGQRVVCVTATAGELGTDDPATWPPSRLGQIRQWEAAAAMAVLGVGEHRLLGLADGGLADLDGTGVELVGGLIDEIAPDSILTFGADGATFHPDHIAVHRWVTSAWEARGRRERLLYAAASTDHLDRFGELYDRWGVYMSDDRLVGVPPGELAVHLQLSGAALDRKLTALRAMATQTAGAQRLMGDSLYAEQAADESFVDAARQPMPARAIR